MGSKIKDIDHGWKNIKREVAKMNDAAVRVGILQDAGKAMERTETGQTVPSDATVAEVAFFNEFGTKTSPERSFIRSTADENRALFSKFIKQQMHEVFAGTRTVQAALERTGLLAQGKVRKKMRDLKAPPNAPATIEAKGSSNPLIDTSHMLKKVDFEVKGARI